MTLLLCVLCGVFFKLTVRVCEWNGFFLIEKLEARELRTRYKSQGIISFR